MKILKSLSLVALLAIVIGFLFYTPARAQENTNTDLANALAEFEADETTAKDLGIEQPNVLPGDRGYNWQIFKEKIGLFFTFDQEQKVTKLEEMSNRRLIEIQQLAQQGTTNAADHIEQALARYRNTMQQVTDKLEANPAIKDRLLEQFDTKQLQHQAVLVEVAEKLKDKLSEDKLNTLKQIREENAQRFYNLDKDKIQERLENALEKNNLGQSKFNTLRVLPTLEAIQESVDGEAQDKIEAVKEKAEEILGDRLQNMSPDDQQKLEKYINNIKAPDLIKQKVVDTLQNSNQLPSAAKQQIKNMALSYSQKLLEKFNAMTDTEKESFLKQFEDQARSHPVFLDFLNQLKEQPQLQARIRNLIQTQEQGLKVKLQQTTNLEKLNSLENNASIKANPTLLKTLREKQSQIRYAPQQNKPMMAPDAATPMDR